MFFSHRRRSKAVRDIAPDEIFLDSHNSPRFDQDQFEGRIERPIGRRAVAGFAIVCALSIIFLLGRTFVLQVVLGDEYHEQAESNRLANTIIFAERGIIYDRTGAPLAWNEPFDEGTTTETVLAENTFARRRYATSTVLSHVLGFVRYPKKDTSGFYFQEEIIGAGGIEKEYDRILAGTPGTKILERNALGDVISESTVNDPRAGNDITLSIDQEVEVRLAQAMEGLAERVGFRGGASVILDVKTGEVLALVSVPGVSSQTLTDGIPDDLYSTYSTDSATPFLNRAIAGRYTPGSIIKPFVAVGALTEGLISPEKEILSTGALEVPNPYDPAHPTIFRDWKAHGLVDMRRALAVSSNVYFFEIGGGFNDQRGLGIAGLEKYIRLFKIGNTTGIDLEGEVEGVVPSIAWKAKLFPDDPWRVGDTYNTSIGQYGLQATPLQMVRAVAAIANGGTLVTPSLVRKTSVNGGEKLSLRSDVLTVVREGMRGAVLDGTARALNISAVEIAGKTGTAELGTAKENVNSWVMGFWPYEKPRFAFATVMEQGPATNLVGSAAVMRELFDWMSIHTPEYLK
ncbi:MAG: penicillin-binding transpeptidase domain-containing protein [Patescibacteria group bacterium]